MRLIRAWAEHLARGRVVRRRLQGPGGAVSWYVSPDAALGCLRWDVRGIDPMLWQCAESLVQAGTRVWDVGANVGLFTVLAAMRAGAEGRVLAVEADPWLVANCLQRTRADLPTHCAQVDVACFAIADQRGTARFAIATRGRASNALGGLGGTQMGGVREELIVAVTTLDELLDATFAPDVVKLDVEGAEGLALAGARRLLQEVRPSLVIECTHGREQAARILRETDYRLFDPRHHFAPLSEPAYDTVAVPVEQPLPWKTT